MTFSYTAFHDKCSEIEHRFGKQVRLPFKSFDMTPVKRDALLDFGSGKKLYSEFCKQYYTVDADADTQPMFQSIENAKSVLGACSVDAIIANQVFEHISIEQIYSIMCDMHFLLKSGGNILITVPNMKHATYFFDEIDHKTTLQYSHIATFLELAGFDAVDAYRYTKKKDMENILGASEFDAYVFHTLQKFYEIDVAKFIAVIGKKK